MSDAQSLAIFPLAATETSICNVNTVIQAAADLFLYWSYLKVPARIIILSSTLPYTFALLAEILGIVQSRASCAMTGQLKVFITAVITVFLTGTGVFWSKKQDSFAFLQLMIAICLKTITILPKAASAIQHLLLRSSRIIFSWTSARTRGMTSTLSRVVPTSYAPTICSLSNRIYHRFATPHLLTTIILFLLDFLFQLPKRWSFFTSRCLGLAIGIMMTDALIRYLEGSLRKDQVQSASGSKGGEGSSGADELATGDDDHFRNVIQRATESCMTSFLALLIASTSSAVIDTTASTSSPLYISQLDRNARIVHFMLIILLCWLVVWGSTALRSTSSREDGVPKEEAATESARRKVLGERRPKWFIAILGTLPLVLAVGKHTMSGTMLGRVYDHYDQVVSRFRAGIKRHLSIAMKTESIC